MKSSVFTREIKKIIEQYRSKWVWGGIIVLSALLITLLFYGFGLRSHGSASNLENQSIASASNLLGISMGDSFDALKEKFTGYAKQKGARAAFNSLGTAMLPPNIDVHLLGHAIGDVLYKQEGAKGMTACTNEFRNACSHSIVVGLFSDKGEGSLPEIEKACEEAPGGNGAYTMCFHGLGHGVLSYFGYSFEKATKICDVVGTPEHHNQEVGECFGGMVMEIIEGGFHDRDIWTKQRPKYLVATKPLGLCQQSFVPESARYLCYVYLTPYLFEVAGGDLGKLTPDVYVKSFKYCAALPATSLVDRDACFGGFGKEFMGVIQGRDARSSSLNKLSAEQFKDVYAWCALANDKMGEGACIVHALNYVYWGGENDASIAFKFCGAALSSYAKETCYRGLFIAVNAYRPDTAYKQSICKEAPEAYTNTCKTMLNI